MPIVVEMGNEVRSEPTPIRSTQHLKVLVVEDNVDSAETLAILLRAYDHEVRTVHDGLQAIEVSERFQPDVILLDLGLPDLDGYDVCRRIRQRPRGRNMIIIALSGWGQQKDKDRSAASGFDLHLVKPVEAQTLIEMLSSAPPGQTPSTAALASAE
jgi:CheY-like chemotaxis protein